MKITITDIAKIADVSVATISRVINNKSKGVSEKTRERVLAIIAEYDFQPSAVARGLVTKTSKIIGLLIPDITNPFYPNLAKGVEDAAHERGYNTVLCDSGNSAEKEVQYLAFLNEHYVSGIIYNNYINISDTTLGIIQQGSLPLVLVDSKIDIPRSKNVHVNNEQAMFELINYLIENGHTKIGFMTGPMNSYSTDERFRGYLKALEVHQIPFDHLLIIEGEYVIENGCEKMGELLDRKVEMTAVACCNDLMAIGALEMLEKRNILVPDDLSIVGFDDIAMSRLVRPKLTTVRQPSYEMGARAANLLIDMIEGKSTSKERNVVMSSQLVVRDSVKNLNT